MPSVLKVCVTSASSVAYKHAKRKNERKKMGGKKKESGKVCPRFKRFTATAPPEERKKLRDREREREKKERVMPADLRKRKLVGNHAQVLVDVVLAELGALVRGHELLVGHGVMAMVTAGQGKK